MAACAYCNSSILFGGVKDADQRYCNAKCAGKGRVLSAASTLPAELVEEQVRAVHSGRCPKCGGSGPIDVHISHRAMSALVITRWSSHPLVSCVSCGTKAQLRDAGVTFLFGWWGFPWGLIFTPVQLGKNLYALAKKHDPRRPPAALYRVVRTNMAARASGHQSIK
jgi:hypothetical protein